MARIQILHLPGGTEEDPRFALVIDRLGGANTALDAELMRLVGESATQQLGAKGVLVFAEDVECPPYWREPIVEPVAVKGA
ncbi:MAG TPA: hypothetical protein VHA75_00905 [Rugosimonospora sp.]|nr:hypothetical protein [Rugosimonospora sp.]